MFSSQIHSSDPKPRFWVQEDVKVWRWSTFNRLFSCFHQDFLIHSRCWGCWFVTWGALHSELSELFVFLTFQDFFEGLWQLRLSFFPLVLKSQVPAHSNVKGKFQWFQCKQTWGSTSKKICQVKKEVVFVFFFSFSSSRQALIVCMLTTVFSILLYWRPHQQISSTSCSHVLS